MKPDLTGYVLATREYVMAPHLNASNKLFGGQLMSWLDVGASMVARQHMQKNNVVTKKFSEMIFDEPGHLGDIVEIWCKVGREGLTSLTLDCIAVVRPLRAAFSATAHRYQSSLTMIGHCEVVFVSLNEEGRPTPWKKSE